MDTTVTNEEEDVTTETAEYEKGTSRFSEDGMETEIEVTPEKPLPSEETKKKRKRKKKKHRHHDKKKDDEDKEDVFAEESKKPTAEVQPKPDKSLKEDNAVEDIESGKRITRKRLFKKKIKKMKQKPLYPLYVIAVCKICFILPIAIYACDVIIGVNVMENTDLGMDLTTSQENLFNVSSAPLLSVADHDYRHKFQRTVFAEVRRLSRERSKRQAVVESKQITAENSTTTTNSIATTKAMEKDTSTLPESERTTASTTSRSLVSSAKSTQTSSALNITEPATKENATIEGSLLTTASQAHLNVTDIPRYTEPSGQYCEHTIYFLEAHRALSAMADSKEDYEYDWYVNMTSILSQYQQALFFMFTVIGVISLLMNIGFRVDAFLNEKWSSSLIIVFLMYMISMPLTAKVFAMQSGSNGVRCFLCRMLSYCEDIDPWDLRPSGYFPLGVNWNTAAFVSIILKVCDCFSIGILTLKYVLDLKNDPAWAVMLKISGWVIIFPILVITPLTGVIRYSVLPVTVPNNLEVRLAMEIIFYVGVAFWAMLLAVLPFFCKARMCNNDVETYKDDYDEYDEY